MPVFLILFIVFIGVPLAEIYVLIEVGRAIGALPTVILLVAIAAFGSWLLRRQGLHTLARVQTALARGELPAAALLDGLVLLLAGALLLAPGFLTDVAGFALLLPPIRRLLAALLSRALLLRTQRQAAAAGSADGDHARVLEGDYRVENEH